MTATTAPTAPTATADPALAPAGGRIYSVAPAKDRWVCVPHHRVKGCAQNQESK